MKKKIAERYQRTLDGKVIIDVTIERVEYIFNYFDKRAPYIRKELDAELVSYLVESVREIGEEPFVIVLSTTERIEGEERQRVEASIQSYFTYLQELERREVAGMGRTSAVFLVVGIAIQVLSIWIDETYSATESVVVRALTAGLTVAAWVALWEALAAVLVNWRPHRRKIRIYERLASAAVFFDLESRTKNVPGSSA